MGESDFNHVNNFLNDLYCPVLLTRYKKLAALLGNFCGLTWQ